MSEAKSGIASLNVPGYGGAPEYNLAVSPSSARMAVG